MKKIITLCLALVIAVSTSFTAFAVNGNFVDSPSNNQAPVLVEGKNEDEECEAELVITPYAERDTLPDVLRETLEDALNIIVDTPDIAVLNEDIVNTAKKYGLKTQDLAVSDMFDIHMTGCDDHDLHGHFDVTLKADTLENFVCLLHYHGDFWHIVEGAEVTHDGTHLEFDAMEFSPFAIVVNTAADEESADDTVVADGDATDLPEGNGNHLLCFIIIIILVILDIILIIAKKDKKAKK